MSKDKNAVLAAEQAQGVNPATTESNNPLDELSTIKSNIDRLQEQYAQSYLEIGKELLRAKDLFGKHGDWLAWAKTNIDMSITKIQRLMRVAKTFKDSASVSYLDYSKAYILTAIPKTDLEGFLRQMYHVDGQDLRKSVEHMTKSELKKVVAAYLLKKRKKSAATNATAIEDKDEDDVGVETESNVNTCLDGIKAYAKKLVEHIDGLRDDSGTRDMVINELNELLENTVNALSISDMEAA